MEETIGMLSKQVKDKDRKILTLEEYEETYRWQIQNLEEDLDKLYKSNKG